MANYPPVHGRVNIVSVKMMEGCCLHFRPGGGGGGKNVGI